jgi:hypothetical protein
MQYIGYAIGVIILAAVVYFAFFAKNSKSNLPTTGSGPKSGKDSGDNSTH